MRETQRSIESTGRRFPGSYRDPDAWVRDVDNGIVTRSYSDAGAARLARLLDSKVWAELVERSLIQVPLAIDLDGPEPWTRHSEIDCWNYPYEWSPSMLHRAARVHLELTLLLGQHGWTTSDASSFNLVYNGADFVFIDVGSFVERRPHEPWWPYQDFCEHFVYPLMVNAYLGLSTTALLRAGVGRVPLVDAYRLLANMKRKPGVLKHVVLPHRLAGDDQSMAEGRDMAAKLPGDPHQDTIVALDKVLDKIAPVAAPSVWGDYGDRSHYANGTDDKASIIGEVVQRLRPQTLLDLGGNDGAFSITYESVGKVVVADLAEDVIDALFSTKQTSNVVPIVMDVCNPSPALGWGNEERSGFFDRVNPDLVLMLALVHHLVISRNVPFQEIARWASGLEADFAVEFVDRDDEKAHHLLARKVDGFPYSKANMLDAFDQHGFTAEFLGDTSGTRSMWLFTRSTQP